jgi:hypothetical protein
MPHKFDIENIHRLDDPKRLEILDGCFVLGWGTPQDEELCISEMR